ncbi:MAG: sugar phosphate isomerase/epimerase, partial [Anaerolineae bacterium]|nr:sugar phosphate isomerase/epimerase [Anaerolineae bacterium]
SRARVVLSTGSLYNLALDRAFELAGSCGYDGVEVLVDARPDTYDVGYLRRLVRRWGVPVLALHTPFAPRVNGWGAESERRVEQTVRLAQELGAETVVAHAPLRWHIVRFQVHSTLGQGGLHFILPLSNRAEERYGCWLREELPGLEERTGVRVGVENMPAGRMLGRRVAHYRLTTVEDCLCWPRLVLDTTHWGTWGVDPAEVYGRVKDRVVHVHLSDYDGREHRMPFAGRLGLERLLGALAAGGYGGLVSVEVDPWAIASGDWGEKQVGRVLAVAAERVRCYLQAPSHSHTPNTTPDHSPSFEERA